MKCMSSDISIRDDHVEISIENCWNLTTEDVKGIPIKIGERTIGRLVEADEEDIYGYVTHVREVFSGEEKFVSFEITK